MTVPLGMCPQAIEPAAALRFQEAETKTWRMRVADDEGVRRPTVEMGHADRAFFLLLHLMIVTDTFLPSVKERHAYTTDLPIRVKIPGRKHILSTPGTTQSIHT